MTIQELDNWFCSLPVKRKEHISVKVYLKEGKDPKEALYPNCTDVWLGLEPKRKESIYHHCTDDHGDWIQEGGDGHIYSY